MWTVVILIALAGFSRAQRRVCSDGSPAYVECDFFSLTCDKKPSLTCEYIDSRFYCCPPVQIGALVATSSSSTQSTRTTTASTSTKRTTLTPNTPRLSIVSITPPFFTSRRTTLSALRPSTLRLAQATTGRGNQRCRDRSRDCTQVAHLCRDRVYYELMTQTCALTCNLCNAMPCEDSSDTCPYWARNGMCTNEFFKRLRMDIQCARSCNMCL